MSHGFYDEYTTLEDLQVAKTVYPTNSNWIRAINVLFSIISMGIVIARYYTKFELMKFRTNRVDEDPSFVMTNMMTPLIVELFFLALVNPPFVEEWSLEVVQIGKQINYTWDAAVVFIATLRLAFYFIRCL